MSTIKDLQDFIGKLRIERENEAKQRIEKLLEKFLQHYFIEDHRPWRAVIGNKRCKPVQFIIISVFTMSQVLTKTGCGQICPRVLFGNILKIWALF